MDKQIVRVSVIIPCYNVIETIERCLQSVFLQGEVVEEIICVDNKSSDSTWEWLTNYSKYNPKVRAFQEPKSGASAARNKGLKEAIGSWVQFLDADDEMLSNKINRQVGLVAERQFAAFVAGAYFKCQGNDLIKVIPEEPCWLGLISGKLGITSSNLWKREEIIRAGGWDEALKSSQEADLMFRILKMGGSAVCDFEPLTIIHQEADRLRISTLNEADNALRFHLLRTSIMDHLFQCEESTLIAHGFELTEAWYRSLDSLRLHNRKEYNHLNGQIRRYWNRLSIRSKIHYYRHRFF